MQIEWSPTAADYARYRAGFSDAFFDQLADRGIASPADAPRRALDLGTGTGSLARGLARRAWQVTGMDVSEAMLAEARRMAASAGLIVQFLRAPAEATGLPDATFDLVIAGTCWHFFDRPRAAREALRLLQPDGWLVVAALDIWPAPGGLVEAVRPLILRHNPRWVADKHSFNFAWAEELPAEGLAIAGRICFDVEIPYTHESWRGRMRAHNGVGASLPPEAVVAFDRDHQQLLQRQFPNEPLLVPHRISAILARPA